MLLTDDCVFLHVPKAAGTFIANALLRAYQSAGKAVTLHDVGKRLKKAGDVTPAKHGFQSEIPASHQHLPKLIALRPPAALYYSHYRFGWWKTHPNTMFDDAKIVRDFASYPELSYPEYVEAFGSARYADHGDHAVMQKRGVGELTRQYLRYVYADGDAALANTNLDAGIPKDVILLNGEKANQSLYHVCKNILQLSEKHIAFLNDAPRENVSANAGEWQQKQTPETTQFIAEREGFVAKLWQTIQ